MEIITKKRMMLFSGTIHPALGSEIAECLGIPVSRSELRRFASGALESRSGSVMPRSAIPACRTRIGSASFGIAFRQLIT